MTDFPLISPPLGEIYMFNKPAGYLTSCRDPYGATVMEFFPEGTARRLHPVGRLDRDTRGLLLFTDDGRVDRALLEPERHVPKKYFFYAIGEVTPEMAEKIEGGVFIGGSGVMSRPAVFRRTGVFTVSQIAGYLPPSRKTRYLKNPNGAAFSAELEISEGRKHQVKLMMRAVGCRVVYLRRISVGGISLDESLPEGGYRPLNDGERKIIEAYVAASEQRPTVKND